MLARDLKVGEYGRITEGVYNDFIIKRGKHGLFDISNGAFHNLSAYILEVEKLENVKITWDGCPETKSEYPKKMWVSDYVNFPKRETHLRTVIAMYKGDYVTVSENFASQLYSWNFAKDIETEEILVHLTLEDISNGKGVGVNPELIRIKK